jgi:hypothetical protein
MLALNSGYQVAQLLDIAAPQRLLEKVARGRRQTGQGGGIQQGWRGPEWRDRVRIVIVANAGDAADFREQLIAVHGFGDIAIRADGKRLGLLIG